MIELSAWIPVQAGRGSSSHPLPMPGRKLASKHQGHKAAQGRKQTSSDIYNLQGRKLIGRARPQAERKKNPLPSLPVGAGQIPTPQTP